MLKILPLHLNHKQLAIALLALVSLLSLFYLWNRSRPSATPIPPATTPSFNSPPRSSDGLINEAAPEIISANQNVYQLSKSLPINIDSFSTSVGITTDIRIFTYPSDPRFVIRVEIYGLDYQDQNTNPAENSDVVAFQESFLKAKQEIEKHGVVLKDMYISFGDKKYIQDTAGLWVQSLRLLN